MVMAYIRANTTEVNYVQNPKLSKYIDASAGAWSSARLCQQRLSTDVEFELERERQYELER